MTRIGTGVLPAAFRLRKAGHRPPYRSVADREAINSEKRINRIDITGPETGIGSNPFGLDRPAFRTNNISGDHVYVDEIVGQDHVYLRFDNASCPPIRLKEGISYARKFDKLLIDFDRPSVQEDPNFPRRNIATRVVLFATWGPFVQVSPAKEYGAEPGFASRFDNTASTTPQIVWQEALNEMNVFDDPAFALFGRGGATLIVTNEDLANDLYLKYTQAGDLSPLAATGRRNWYRLPPGASIEMTLESLMDTVAAVSGVSARNGIFVATLSGTCKYSFLISKAPMQGPVNLIDQPVILEPRY